MRSAGFGIVYDFPVAIADTVTGPAHALRNKYQPGGPPHRAILDTSPGIAVRQIAVSRVGPSCLIHGVGVTGVSLGIGVISIIGPLLLEPRSRGASVNGHTIVAFSEIIALQALPYIPCYYKIEGTLVVRHVTGTALPDSAISTVVIVSI